MDGYMRFLRVINRRDGVGSCRRTIEQKGVDETTRREIVAVAVAVDVDDVSSCVASSFAC
jgi:hypothetical protein